VKANGGARAHLTAQLSIMRVIVGVNAVQSPVVSNEKTSRVLKAKRLCAGEETTNCCIAAVKIGRLWGMDTI
jgi:hypothetical protein